MRQGLKRVAHRRDDALTGGRWDRLEHLLAEYYREAGYQVEHVGTGASAGRFDGGVDLKLQRDGRVLLVQVKHWNAYKVPHNEVHQLIGLMVIREPMPRSSSPAVSSPWPRSRPRPAMDSCS